MILNKMSHLFYQFYFIALRQKTKYKFTLLYKKSFLQKNVVLLKYRRKFFIREFSKKQNNRINSKERLQINPIFFSDLRFKKKKFLNKDHKQSTESLTLLKHQLTSQSLFVTNNFYRLNYNNKLNYLYPTNLDKMSFLSSDLANLGLSLETYTFLKEKKINKIGNLVKYSSRSLLQILNKDRETFAEIKRCFFFTALC